MATTTLAEHLAKVYPYTVVPDTEDGGFVIDFPDLPGCMTQVEDASEIAAMADEVRRLWITSQWKHGERIPEPSLPATHSGKFMVRLPRSLHRDLARSAEREGTSLNAYVTALLARGDAQARIERNLDAIAASSAVDRPRQDASVRT